MSKWEEAAQTWRKHANLSQKGPGQMVDLNPGTACCEATELTTVSPYYPFSSLLLSINHCSLFHH